MFNPVIQAQHHCHSDNGLKMTKWVYERVVTIASRFNALFVPVPIVYVGDDYSPEWYSFQDKLTWQIFFAFDYMNNSNEYNIETEENTDQD